MEIKKNKVFISHSNKGVEIVKAFVELLEDIGMPEDSIVCTSVPGYCANYSTSCTYVYAG